MEENLKVILNDNEIKELESLLSEKEINELYKIYNEIKTFNKVEKNLFNQRLNAKHWNFGMINHLLRVWPEK
jgi:hypothetical protein